MNKLEAINEAIQELEYEFFSMEGKRTEQECLEFQKQWQKLATLREKTWLKVVSA